MITLRYYDKGKRLDRVWYDSSNIVYTECEDKLNDLKTLRVVFKKGATYEYKKVDVNDYVLFVAGGIHGSNGKALNEIIKPKYEFEKIEDTNLDKLESDFAEISEMLAAEKASEDADGQSKND